MSKKKTISTRRTLKSNPKKSVMPHKSRPVSSTRGRQDKAKKMSPQQIEAALFGDKKKDNWFTFSTGISVALLLAFAASFIHPGVSDFLKASLLSKPQLEQIVKSIPANKSDTQAGRPIVDFQGIIITCDDLRQCDHREVQSVLVDILPGISVEVIPFSSPTAEEWIDAIGLNSFPAVIVENGIERSDIWFAMKDFFRQSGDYYVFETALLNAGNQWFSELPALIDSDAVLGRDFAAVTITEFSNYSHSPNQKYFLDMYGILKTKYIDTGRVKYVVKEVPAANDLSQRAARVAMASFKKNPEKYWSVRRELMNDSSDQGLQRIITALGITESDLMATAPNHDGKIPSGSILVGQKLYSMEIGLRELESLIVELER